ncbi:TraB/GumN family protein [Flavobacterium pedocola]
MKTFIQTALLAVTTFFGTAATAQAPKPETSLLWEISGNGLQKSSYLYGTVHLMCESDFKMTEKTKTAFRKSSKVAMEVDLDDMAELTIMQESALSKEPLSKRLSKEDYQKLDAFLKEKLGKGAKEFENHTLVTIMSIVMLQSLNCPPKMYEVEFMSMASARKMDIVGLEKMSEQLDFFNKAFSSKAMVEQLIHYDSEYFKQLVLLYNSEDIQKIYEMTIEPKYMDAEGKKWLLDNRNANWVAKMPELLKKESVFIAVGAAHLGGEQGVIQLLRKAGYTVQPVMQ